ncbi:MAG: zf-TFIIB domain-containing protein [Spirochaetia bacterium]|nr:zf-TFIIB domain-containing protein [Spirochaetia bacterium]
MNCPKCHAILKPITYRNITIDKCSRCEGVWLDKGEEGFVSEILRHSSGSVCIDCEHFVTTNRQCEKLKIFVSQDFSCGNFVRL